MKFANYKFIARGGVNNLGDNLQIITIDYIYSQMGIDLKEVVYIDTQNLDSYRGEYVILPVSMPLVDYRENGIAGRFSPYIIPVFLGLTIVRDKLLPEEVAYYKKYEPIGCRDERTLNTLRKYQIQCYLHGCITITLPKRECMPEHPKVYIVDVNPELLEQIPQNLRENAHFCTHLRTGLSEDPKEVARRQYQEYKDHAGLVITSLLHCAIPCMAAGIPVIMIKEKISYRMSWLEKLLPIYTGDTMKDIVWEPEPVCCEKHGKWVLDITKKRLEEAVHKNEVLYDLSWFYEDRKKENYVNDACDSLKRFVDENWTDFQKEYTYSVWGLTQMSEWLIDYISERYPKAKLCHVYDSFRKLNLRGHQSEKPEKIAEALSETVFVTTNGAEPQAKELFKQIGKPEGTYAFLKVIQ